MLGAINAVMSDVGTVGKDGNNSHHNYNYATVSAVLGKVQPLMAKHGLVIIQTELERSLIDDGNVLAITYQFLLFHTSTPSTSLIIKQTGLCSARNSKGGFDDKAANKCHTAARKYFILALFQIPTVELDDADKEADRPAQPKLIAKNVIRQEPAKVEAVAPHAIPHEGVKLVDWTVQFAAAINAATSKSELDEWLGLNKTPLDAVEQKSEPLYKKIDEAISAAYAALPALKVAA